MGKKYDELYERVVKDSLEISGNMVAIGIEMMKIDIAMHKVLSLLSEISDININLTEKGERHDKSDN